MIESTYFVIADRAEDVCYIIKQKQKNPAHIVWTDKYFVLFFIEGSKQSAMDKVW